MRAWLADFGDEGTAESENDVAVLVGVLENGIAAVVFEAPAGGRDDFTVTIECFIGGDEVETRIARIIGILRGGWLADFNLQRATQAGPAIGKGDEAGRKIVHKNNLGFWFSVFSQKKI